MTASYPGEKDVPYRADTAPQEGNLFTITQHQIRTTETSREAFFPLQDSLKKDVFYFRNRSWVLLYKVEQKNLILRRSLLIFCLQFFSWVSKYEHKNESTFTEDLQDAKY